MGSGFSKEDTRMGNKHVKRWPTPVAIRETHVKTTMRCHLTQRDHQRVHKQQMLARAWGEGTFLHSCWECRLLQPLWRTVGRVLKRLRIKLPQDPALSLLRMYPKEMKRLYARDSRTAPLFTLVGSPEPGTPLLVGSPEPGMSLPKGFLELGTLLPHGVSRTRDAPPPRGLQNQGCGGNAPPPSSLFL